MIYHIIRQIPCHDISSHSIVVRSPAAQPILARSMQSRACEVYNVCDIFATIPSIIINSKSKLVFFLLFVSSDFGQFSPWAAAMSLIACNTLRIRGERQISPTWLRLQLAWQEIDAPHIPGWVEEESEELFNQPSVYERMIERMI